MIELLKYYKVIENDYIAAIGINIEGVEIKKNEYDNLLNLIRNKPVTSEEYDYWLRTDLTWEKHFLSYEIANSEEEA